MMGIILKALCMRLFHITPNSFAHCLMLKFIIYNEVMCYTASLPNELSMKDKTMRNALRSVISTLWQKEDPDKFT